MDVSVDDLVLSLIADCRSTVREFNTYILKIVGILVQVNPTGAGETKTVGLVSVNTGKAKQNLQQPCKTQLSIATQQTSTAMLRYLRQILLGQD